MPTMGALSRAPATSPRSGASPLVNTVPFDDTDQAPSPDGVAAPPTTFTPAGADRVMTTASPSRIVITLPLPIDAPGAGADGGTVVVGVGGAVVVVVDRGRVVLVVVVVTPPPPPPP